MSEHESQVSPLKELVRLSKELNQQIDDGDGAYPSDFQHIANLTLDSADALEALLSRHEKLVAAVRKLQGVSLRGTAEAILAYDELMQVLSAIEGGPTA